MLHRPKTPMPIQQKMLKTRAQGMAMLAVLWMVAALTIMVSGLLQVVRGEVAIAGQFRKTVMSNGLADAAIRLTLRELVLEKEKPIKSVLSKSVTIFGQEVKIEIIPLNGYVDLNNAPVELLADAFEYGGGIPKIDAQRLANSAVEARNRKGPDGLPVRFHALEDLLQLNGLEYSAYAKMKDSLTVDITSSGRINPLAASMDTMRILTKGDLSRAKQLIESRLPNSESMDTTTLTATGIDIVPTSYLAIRATTIQQDASLLRIWRVDISSPAYGLPWRVLGIDPSIVTDNRISQ